ncbi:hypothetical protein EBB_03805 [Methylomonas sp. EbB]|uniref:Uncharacterized protein n=1 Tax=Methylomonas fluvii TaxID=1854564 RepID=A0ABR9D9A4_9GAMM|nr:hypothetical protein [Methylomonas fluvii]MBD9359685.1 hypothetical protein [Methylomonas fluvii]
MIKIESLQRDIEALEQEKRQRLGQEAAATDQGPSAADSPVGKVKTLTVNKGALESPCAFQVLHFGFESAGCAELCEAQRSRTMRLSAASYSAYMDSSPIASQDSQK